MPTRSITEDADQRLAFASAINQLCNSLTSDMSSKEDNHWIFFNSNRYRLPMQGWKIHMTTVPTQFVQLVQQVGPILNQQGIHWKMVSPQALDYFFSDAFPLSQTGKFITIYPENEQQFVSLLEQLDQHTSHLTGPVIPTDKAYRNGGCVYYRYGAFQELSFFDPITAIKINAIHDPEGNVIEDSRIPGQFKPTWVEEPSCLSNRHANARPTRANDGSAFQKRGIKVLRVLKKASKGGVFAIRSHDHSYAILKEARNHMRIDSYGRSTHHYIRNEFDILTMMQDEGCTPQPYELFSFGDNTYMMIEYIQGNTLRDSVKEQHIQSSFDRSTIMSYCHQLINIVHTFHRQHLVINDLTPNNVMITSEGNLKLIDLELAYSIDSVEKPLHGHTPGYTRRAGNAPLSGIARDYYALGAIYYYMATALDPYFKYLDEDIPACEHYLDAIDSSFLQQLGWIGISLMKQDISDLTSIHNQIADLQHKDIQSSPKATLQQPAFCKHELLQHAQLLADDLYAQCDFSNLSSLFPTTRMSQLFHPANFNFGIAGVAHFFNHIGLITGQPFYSQRAEHLIHWLLTHHPFEPEQTPAGLYFGFGAIPWLMADIDQQRPDPLLGEKACALACLLAQSTHSQVNISHGSAGVGLMLLKLYRQYGTPVLLQEACRLADDILASEKHINGMNVWEVQDNHRNPNSVYHPLGFSHGIAGIGYFILMMYETTHVSSYKQACLRIIDTLKNTSKSTGRHALVWPISLEKPDNLWVHWCNGSAGIGRFLLQASLILDRSDIALLSKQAIDAVADTHYFASFNQCHGIAGNSALLLAANQAFPNRYTHKIDLSLQLLDNLKASSGKYWLWPSEDMQTYSSDYMTGYTGVYSFLLRNYFPSAPHEPFYLSPITEYSGGII